MKVKFENVGRENRSWEVNMPDNVTTGLMLTHLHDSVMRSGALLSQGVHIVPDESLHRGFVLAGFHEVGRWHVVED